MSDSVITAPITQVTVLEDRAAIERRGVVTLAAGQHRVIIERVAPVLVDKTLTAVAEGARVLDVRCERYLAPWRDPDAVGDDAIASLHAERTRLDGEREAQLAKIATARVELSGLAEVAVYAMRELAETTGRAVAAQGVAAQLAALDAADAEARVRLVTAELAARDLELARRRLDARISRAEAESGTQAARLVIDLQVDAPGDAPGDIQLTLGYITPGAAWRPYHRAMLIDGPSVEWQTTACVWQATGEDWPSVKLVFSLERPSLGVEPPDLADDELAARRRPDTVTVEARDQELHTTGLGGAPGGPAQVPGIDDNGLGITLSAPRATVAADGAPHRIPVGGFTAKAELDLLAIPLRSPAVHQRARLINTGGPLLAGPVDLVMSSGYVGRAEVGFVAGNEKLALGFGPASDVRIHRSEARERDDAGLLGGWNVTTVRVALRLSNLGAQPRSIIVTERVPVSEVEQVEIQVAAPDAYLISADDNPGGEQITQITARAIDDRGLVSWTVELPPLGRRAVALEYRVRSQRGVAGIP